MSITKREFGKLQSGAEVSVYQIKNEAGAYIEVTDFGAILRCICVPDKDGKLVDVVLGYDDLEHYFVNGCYFGSTIGRNGNRIADGLVKIQGQEYQMPKNENGNNLHSGPDGYEKQLWKVKEVSQEENAVTFERISPDKEQGLPGNFTVAVTYQLTGENEVKIHYRGVSDQDTLVNMTNHSYFNLSGEGSGSVLNQSLCLRSGQFTPVIDSKSIPTGEYADTADTPMDFRVEKKIGQDIDADYQQLLYTGGYDHNFMLMDYQPGVVRSVAKAYSPDTQISMEVLTDTPAVQFYSGNFIVKEDGKNGHVYGKRDGFCLETQFEPDAVNHENFHSPVLKAGEKYDSTTIYRFSVRK